LVLREAGAVDRVVDAILQGFAAKFNSISAVGNAIEDSIGESGIADDVVPLLDRHLNSDWQRTGVVYFQLETPVSSGQQVERLIFGILGCVLIKRKMSAIFAAGCSRAIAV
jgi:hypothetical protein